MKKFLLIVSLLIASVALKAQTVILCENFNTYDTTTAATGVFNGFTVSYHSIGSYYTSTTSSGASGPNSYKFGVDSCTMISPDITGANYLQFWMKGNATDSLSTFYIYDSPDGTNWTLVQSINPVNTTGMNRQYPLHANAARVKFFYDKSVGNVAFDDFCASDGPLSVGTINTSGIPTVSPNPTDGKITVRSNNAVMHDVTITVTNILGKTLKTFTMDELTVSDLDLTTLDNGVYFVHIKTDKGEYLQRLILRK